MCLLAASVCLFLGLSYYLSLCREGSFAKQEDLEVILKRHSEMQEQIAEDMIRIARNMKEHQLIARKIIKDDTEASSIYMLSFCAFHSVCLSSDTD